MTSQSSVDIALSSTLEDAKIANLPSSAFYIPNFISEGEEQFILDKVATAPKPRWKQLTHRRLQTWPSDLVNDVLLDAPLPKWLFEPIVPRLLSLSRPADGGMDIFFDSPHNRPNHVLINEYPPGVGIMPHKDGAAYHPVVCTVSLGSALCLNIHQSKSDGSLDREPVWRILQEPRSLLITTDDLYNKYLHGIADIEHDADLGPETIANWNILGSKADYMSGSSARQPRTSLTYRDVVRVSKLGNKLGAFLGKR